jgi:hypothetical protein
MMDVYLSLINIRFIRHKFKGNRSLPSLALVLKLAKSYHRRGVSEAFTAFKSNLNKAGFTQVKIVINLSIFLPLLSVHLIEILLGSGVICAFFICGQVFALMHRDNPM